MSAPPNAITLWVVVSNAAFLVPLALAVKRDALRAVGLAALFVVSSIYHYAHDTEQQSNKEAWYNGFTEDASWQLNKADTILSLWAAAAAALLLLPTQHHRWLDVTLQCLAALGATLIVTQAGYNKCARGIQRCSSDWLPLWYLVNVVACVLLGALWLRCLGVVLWRDFGYNVHRWGTARTVACASGIVATTTAALLLYTLVDARAWHGVWHVLCAAALSLTLLWHPPLKDTALLNDYA